MLEDFIVTNRLKSQLINFPTDITINLIAQKNIFPKKYLVKLKAFITKENDLFITIIPFNLEIDFEKLKNIILEEEFLELNEDECFDITGYKKNYLPPISIYGAKIIIDTSLKNNELLISKTDEKQLFKAQMNEVLEYNDEVEFVDLVK